MINYYIMVVDDDPNIRMGLTRELEQEFGQAATILSCENGAVASNLIQYNAVDILITDIKMPVMNGIELLHFIQERSINCKSIVLSGFDDFNLVRDAMKYGAVDYLLKPVDFGLLNEAVCKLLSAAAASKEGLLDGTSVINRQQVLEHYIKGGREKTEEVLIFEEKYGLSDESTCTAGCVKLQSLRSGQGYELQKQLKSRLCGLLHTLRRSDAAVLAGEYHSLWIFLILSPAGRPMEESDLAVIREELCKILSEDSRLLQISAGHTPLSSASMAVTECMEGFESAFYDLPYRNVPAAESISAEPGGKEKAIAELTDSLLSKSVSSVSHYQTASMLTDLTALFALFNHQKPPVSHVKRLFTNFVYSVINENSKFIEPVSNSKFTDYDIFRQIETAESLSELQKNMFSSLNHLIGEIVQSASDREDYMIQAALDYIHRNYNDCITLNDTAAHVYLNKNYFSTLFKNKVGTTFREYLRDYRIKEAVKLIRDSDMKIYEIAQMVGYNDSAHFIRAFKEVTGKSPSAYKDA